MPSSPQKRLFLFSGDDEIRLHAKAEAMFRKLAGEEPDDFTVDIISEDDQGPRPQLLQQVIASLRQPPFMGGMKTIWLRQFTGFSQEPTGKSGADPMGIRALTAFLAQSGMPQDACLILEGPKCAEKGELAGLCKKLGICDWSYRTTVGRKGWREEMKASIAQVTSQKCITLSREAQEALVDALGGDSSLIDTELEKLVCYMGGDPKVPVTEEAVRELSPPFGDQENWAIQDPVGKRNLAAALSQAERLMARDKNPEDTARSLLYGLARQFRTAMSLRLYMAEHRLASGNALKSRLESLSPEERKKENGETGGLLAGNLWKLKFSADDALNYTPHELIQAIVTLRDTLLTLNTGGLPAPVELENALLKILPKEGRRP
ncbi:MAG: DNA polymerase III subunit delta [Oligosphaeraceae bacterium]